MALAARRLIKDPLWQGLLLAALVAALAWAAQPIAPVTSARFAADSSRRETRYARDSTDRVKNEARRDSIAERTSRRVDLLVCRTLTNPTEREACLR